MASFSLPTVKLFTNDGRFVSEQEILPFVHWPECVFWGSRLFVARIGRLERIDGVKPDYYEADGYAAVGLDFSDVRVTEINLSDEPKPHTPSA